MPSRPGDSSARVELLQIAGHPLRDSSRECENAVAEHGNAICSYAHFHRTMTGVVNRSSMGKAPRGQ